jgi:predicted ATPase
MLTELRVQNFKSWGDTQTLRLAPITVFFGTNSSGKSSIGQLLLMLKQTAESPDRTRVLHTGDQQSLVDLGDFRSLVHHHDDTRDLAFALAWTQPDAIVIDDPKNESVHHKGSSIRFTAKIFQPPARPGQLRVRSMSYELLDDEVPPFMAGMEPDSRRSSRYKLMFQGFSPVRNRGRSWELPAPARFYGFPDEAVAYYQNTEFLPDLSLALERALGSITYLGPLRVDPERVYTWSGGTPEDVGWAGEHTVEAILAAGERLYNYRHRGRTRRLQQVLAEAMRELGLIASFEVAAIAEGRAEREVRIRIYPRGDEVLITDVGFGISQVLPVLVQSYYAPPGSTILLEQPELHLHPSVQKGLADFFITAAFAREDGVERNTQFVIESHSEHFLRRLQRRIAEERLRPDQVALYFCEASASGSSIRELEVDLFGDITDWPKDFFGDPVDDIAGQAEARLKREMQS